MRGAIATWDTQDHPFLCLSLEPVELPLPETVYDLAMRLIAPYTRAYPAIGVLHGLERVFGPYTCDFNPQMKAAQRAFEDTLATQWEARLAEQLKPGTPTPEFLAALKPLAEALVPLADYREVWEELPQWVLPMRMSGGGPVQQGFCSPSYSAAVVCGALAANTDPEVIADILAHVVGGASYSDHPAHVLAEVSELLFTHRGRRQSPSKAATKAKHGVETAPFQKT